MKKFRIFVMSFLFISLLLGGLITYSQQVHVQVGGAGGRAAMGYFFGAMFSNDLTFMKDGGVLSGRVEFEQLDFSLDDGGLRTVMRDEIGIMIFSDGTDELALSTGEQLYGQAQVDTLNIISPSGETVNVATADIAMVMINQGHGGGIEVEEETEDGQATRTVMIQSASGLRSQNLFAQFAKAMTSYDLLVYPGFQLWSGTVLTDQVVFHSNSFGTLTINAADLSSIELGSSADARQDFITMKIGDRVSGTLDEGSTLRFQPVGITDDQGNPVTLTLERGQIQVVSFKQPASAFGGGGRGPGLGGGPGN